MTHTTWPEPKVKRVRKDVYELTAPYKVRITQAGNRPHDLVIPGGFQTDFASVPSGLDWIVPKYGGHYVIATLVHDYLYVTRRYSRREADAIFLAIMRANKVAPTVRLAMWFAVRAFGGNDLLKRFAVTA